MLKKRKDKTESSVGPLNEDQNNAWLDKSSAFFLQFGQQDKEVVQQHQNFFIPLLNIYFLFLLICMATIVLIGNGSLKEAWSMSAVHKLFSKEFTRNCLTKTSKTDRRAEDENNRQKSMRNGQRGRWVWLSFFPWLEYPGVHMWAYT